MGSSLEQPRQQSNSGSHDEDSTQQVMEGMLASDSWSDSQTTGRVEDSGFGTGDSATWSYMEEQQRTAESTELAAANADEGKKYHLSHYIV